MVKVSLGLGSGSGLCFSPYADVATEKNTHILIYIYLYPFFYANKIVIDRIRSPNSYILFCNKHIVT